MGLRSDDESSVEVEVSVGVEAVEVGATDAVSITNLTFLSLPKLKDSYFIFLLPLTTF